MHKHQEAIEETQTILTKDKKTFDVTNKPIILSLDTTGRASQPASLPANPHDYQKNYKQTIKHA